MSANRWGEASSDEITKAIQFETTDCAGYGPKHYWRNLSLLPERYYTKIKNFTMDSTFFNAETFVQNLLDEGEKDPCDETVKSFQENKNLPSFYDEALYKKGQEFFNRHIFALFFSKILGLITILSIPSILHVLIFTKMSGSPLAAYRRYLATLFHTVIWYRRDFTSESVLWQSVMDVKNKHNSASKRCISAGFQRITQKDMALTQFGFVGFALAKREKVGLHNVSNEDLKGFVHIWRVIGFLLGIEDRFNICRESVEETTAICRTLAEKVFRPAVARMDKDFLAMSTYLTQGMWAFNPTLGAKIYLNLVYKLLLTSDNNNLETKKYLIKLNFVQRICYRIIVFVIWSLQFSVFRLYHNYTQFLSLWIIKVCPFLAYYKFGYSNSFVKVPTDEIKNH